LQDSPGITSVFEDLGRKGDTLLSLVLNPETPRTPLSILCIGLVNTLDVPIAKGLFQIDPSEGDPQFEWRARSAHPAVSFVPSGSDEKKRVA
jgi:hypothetical protein